MPTFPEELLRMMRSEVRPTAWQRLHLIMSFTNCAPMLFARSVGMEVPGRICRILRDGAAIPRELADPVCYCYPFFSKRWLLTGEGSLFAEGTDEAALVGMWRRHCGITRPASAAVPAWIEAYGRDCAYGVRIDAPIAGRWLLTEIWDRCDGGEWTRLTEYDANSVLDACYVEFGEEGRMLRFDGTLPGEAANYSFRPQTGELVLPGESRWVTLLTHERMETLCCDEEGTIKCLYQRVRRL